MKDAATFELVRATYISTVKSLAPAGECAPQFELSHRARRHREREERTGTLRCFSVNTSTTSLAQPAKRFVDCVHGAGLQAVHSQLPRRTRPVAPSVPSLPHEIQDQLPPSTVRCSAGAISEVIPFSTEPNKLKGGILAHTIILLGGSCEAGKVAARALHVKLLGDVRPMFYVYAPSAKSLFGDVYMVTIGFPYLVRGSSRRAPVPSWRRL